MPRGWRVNPRLLAVLAGLALLGLGMAIRLVIADLRDPHDQRDAEAAVSDLLSISYSFEAGLEDPLANHAALAREAFQENVRRALAPGTTLAALEPCLVWLESRVALRANHWFDGSRGTDDGAVVEVSFGDRPGDGQVDFHLVGEDRFWQVERLVCDERLSPHQN